MGILDPIRKLTSQSVIWPPIEYELMDAKKAGYLKGKILNAGAGWRDLSHLVDGELVNQDLTWPDDDRKNIHIFSPIHNIPVADNTFDTILCIAVLEHVENPEEIIPEFLRVLKPGGIVVASVPFMQPEHKIPTDYQRFTKDGLERLFRHRGFEILSCQSVFTVYHSLHWIVYEWLHMKNTLAYRFLRLLFLPVLAYRARHSRLASDKLASVFQVLARKPVAT